MNTITAIQIMDAADEVGIEISPRLAARWVEEVWDLYDFDAWLFIWDWIYAAEDLKRTAEV